MENSAILLPRGDSQLVKANGFTEDGEIEAIYLRDISAGGLAASANDMGKFVQLFLGNGNDVVSRNLLQMMMQAQNDDVELDGDLRFGLSFFMSAFGEEPFLIHHGGDSYPYHAYLRILPEEGLGIVVMTNSSRGASVVRQASSQILDVAFRARSPVEPDSTATSERHHSRDFSISEEQARTYEGLYYAGPNLGFVDIRSKGNDLTLKFYETNLATAKMVPVEDDKFDVKLRLFGFIPLPMDLVFLGVEEPHFELKFADIEGKNHFWLTADGVSMQLAQPVDRSAVPETWLARIGSYRIADGSVSPVQSAELAFNDKSGFLYITVANDLLPPISLPMQILSDNQASIMGVGRFSGEIIDVMSDKTISYGGITLERE